MLVKHDFSTWSRVPHKKQLNQDLKPRCEETARPETRSVCAWQWASHFPSFITWRHKWCVLNVMPLRLYKIVPKAISIPAIIWLYSTAYGPITQQSIFNLHFRAFSWKIFIFSMQTETLFLIKHGKSGSGGLEMPVYCTTCNMSLHNRTVLSQLVPSY